MRRLKYMEPEKDEIRNEHKYASVKCPFCHERNSMIVECEHLSARSYDSKTYFFLTYEGNGYRRANW